MKSKINLLIGILVIFVAVTWSAVFQRAGDQFFRLFMLDVGQGMAIYIRFPDGFDVLYDGGPDDKILTELGSVMPAWDRQINLIISSHNHSDHLVGLIAVLERYKVDEVWTSGAIHTTQTYQKFLEAIDESGAKNKTCFVKTDCNVSLQDGKIFILYPFNDLTGARPENQNNASLVARIEYGQTTILLPGEVEKEAEAEIVQYYCPDEVETDCNPSLQSDILQSPHQGSKTSSTDRFLDAVNPKAILIAVGAGNQYGHPHQEVLDRYRRHKIKYQRTDQCGRLEVKADLENYQIISNCLK